LIFREGQRQPINNAPSKRDAVETAKIMARGAAPSQVVVERTNGSLFVKYTFPRPNEEN
jgi:hypothetical protein